LWGIFAVIVQLERYSGIIGRAAKVPKVLILSLFRRCGGNQGYPPWCPRPDSNGAVKAASNANGA
jgi:hypothetical protein